MTEPTDSEIFVVAREAGLLPDNSHPAPETRAARKHSNAVQAFARAVLAKWGTPPVVAGEPVGEFDQMRGRLVILEGAPMFKHRQKVYTTPQPTQAQAGAVPQPAVELGPDGKEWAKTEAGYAHVDEMLPRADGHCIGPFWYGWALRGAFVAGAEWQEARQIGGIKGGQHGADT